MYLLLTALCLCVASDEGLYLADDFERRPGKPLVWEAVEGDWEVGFEVRVWREGDIPAGVHDSVLDNLEGRVQQVGDNSYRLAVDIADAPGVGRLSGQYLWSVYLVRVSPNYQELGPRAEPATFRFESPGG